MRNGKALSMGFSGVARTREGGRRLKHIRARSFESPTSSAFCKVGCMANFAEILADLGRPVQKQPHGMLEVVRFA